MVVGVVVVLRAAVWPPAGPLLQQLAEVAAPTLLFLLKTRRKIHAFI
jgi:hypothetical protein